MLFWIVQNDGSLFLYKKFTNIWPNFLKKRFITRIIWLIRKISMTIGLMRQLDAYNLQFLRIFLDAKIRKTIFPPNVRKIGTKVTILTATLLAVCQWIAVQSVNIVKACRPVRVKLPDTGVTVILQSVGMRWHRVVVHNVLRRQQMIQVRVRVSVMEQRGEHGWYRRQTPVRWQTHRIRRVRNWRYAVRRRLRVHR